MQLIKKFNKGFRFLLCVIDFFSKYACVVPLKNKERITINNAIRKNFKKFNRKPNKTYGLIKKGNFAIVLLKNG